MSGKGSEREKVPIQEKEDRKVFDSEPVLKEDHDFDRMHHKFVDTHGYLKDSLSDLDFMRKRIKALKAEENRKEREEFVDFHERRSRLDSDVNIKEMSKSKRFKKRKLINKAVILVKRKLESKGYSREFINDSSDVIKEKIEEFLLED